MYQGLFMKKTLAVATLLAASGAFANPFGAPVPRPSPQAQQQPAVAPAVADDGELRLIAELTVDEQLSEWARRTGWTFRWYPDVTWKVIAPSQYGKDFEKAFIEVMEILMHEEGKPLRFAVSRGNKVVEVFANDLQ